MRDLRGQDDGDDAPASLAPEPTRGDRIAGAVLLGGFVAVCAVAVAWMLEVGPVGLVFTGLAGVLAGALAGVAAVTYQPFGSAGSQAFRQATEEYEGPGRHGDAIRRALVGQKGMLAVRMTFWAIWGALLGGMLSRGVGGPLATLFCVVLGAAAGTGLGLLVWPVLTASTVLIVRTAGLPLGYAILAGLCGAIWGMELWRAWWHVPWPNVGALALGVPMALLMALVGWQRSRLKRKPVGKPRDSELG